MKDELISHKEQRKRLWCDAWNACASASNCVSAETCTRYADKALDDFDKRFPEPSETNNI